jgi:hypothetical protein
MARPPVTPDPAADATIVPITLRLYCHGLGDCLLVSLPVADGGPPFRLLIDCGIHSASRAGPARIAAVVDDLAVACEGRIDAIVGTHEHWDHLSGFLTARDRFVDAETPGLADDDPRIRVGDVWLAWTENPDDAMGSAIDRYKDAGQETLVGLRLAMAAAPAESLPDGLADGMDGLFGFLFGAQPGQRVRSAREALRGLVPAARVRYLEPGSLVPLPERVGDVRIHVLGPPRDPALLRVHDDPADGYKLAFGNHPETLALATALAIADGTLDLRDDPAARSMPNRACRFRRCATEPRAMRPCGSSWIAIIWPAMPAAASTACGCRALAIWPCSLIATPTTPAWCWRWNA